MKDITSEAWISEALAATRAMMESLPGSFRHTDAERRVQRALGALDGHLPRSLDPLEDAMFFEEEPPLWGPLWKQDYDDRIRRSIYLYGSAWVSYTPEDPPELIDPSRIILMTNREDDPDPPASPANDWPPPTLCPLCNGSFVIALKTNPPSLAVCSCTKNMPKTEIWGIIRNPLSK